MTKTEKKNIATSLTTMIFLVVGTSGIMMFFHIFDYYTQVIHEILGLAFVIIAGFHVFYNWASMKSYFGKKVFLIASIFVFVVSLSFIFNAQGNEKIEILKIVISSPIKSAVGALGSNMQTAKIRFKEAGIKFKNEKSINELAINNELSPLDIIGIIIK